MGSYLLSRRIAVGGAMLALVVPAQQSLAQDATGSVPGEIEEIVVTASRRAETLQDTPLAVSVIDPEELIDAGLVKMREVVEYAPGVYFSGGASPVANTVTMRGVAQLGRASTVGIYLDDIPLGSSTSFAAGPTIQFDGIQSDLQRVELIRGPQGTLYGSSAMGGVMRYISRDPSAEEFSANVSVDLSSIQHGSDSTTVRGRVGLPVIDGKLGMSVAAYQEDFGGFINRIESSPTGAATNVDAFDREGIFVKVNANPTERFFASLQYIDTEVTSTGVNLVALDGPPFVLANGPYNTDEGAGNLLDTFEVAGLTLKYDFGAMTLISSTSHQDRSNSNAVDLVATFGPLVDLLEGNAAGTTTSAPFTGKLLTERFVQEVRLESDTGGKTEWSVGGIYSTEDSSNIQTLQGLPTDFLALNVDLASWLDETAVFGNVTYYFSDRFDVGFGARVAWIDSAVALTDGPGLIVANLPKTSSEDTVDTYNLTFRYRPSDTHSVYGRIASGYRPENANLPLLDANGNNAAPPIIETDTLWSYEIGSKGSLLDNGFFYDLSAYYIKWKEPQVVTFVNGAATGGNANSDVTAYGFEASGSIRTDSGLVITGSASYVNSTLDNDETAALGALAGEELQLLPRFTASLRANRDFPITADFDGFVSGGVRFVDQRNTGYLGGTGSGGMPVVPLIENFTMGSYMAADLSIGIRTNRFSATLYGNNLFDEYGFTGGSARPAVGFTRATANVLQPRTLGVILAVDF